MKIIQLGEWKLKINCKGCKSVLEAASEDVRYGVYETDYDSEFEGQFYIQCPVCSKKNVRKDIPDKIAEETKESRKD